MTRQADYGRSACYRAERIAFAPEQCRNLDEDTVREWVDTVVAILGDGRPIRTEFGRLDGAEAYPFQRRIRFGTARDLPTILHEVAHVLTAKDIGHGPEWRRCFVRLVRETMGEESAERLADAFSAEGVPIDATMVSVVRRKETRPRRRFVLVERRETARHVLKVEGNVTTYRSEWSEWTPSTFDVPAADRAMMRQGWTFYYEGGKVQRRLEPKK